MSSYYPFLITRPSVVMKLGLSGAFICTLLLLMWLLLPAHPVYAQDEDGPSTEVSVAEFSLSVPPARPDDAVLLPFPRGPYQVGTRTYHWVLDELEELTSSPSDRREVIAQLFYPARRTGGDVPPIAYMPELPLLRRGLLTHGFPPFAELSERLSVYAAVQIVAWHAEPLLKAEGPFPVVLISPGGNMSRHWHTALSQELASQGYVVATMSHAHSGMDVFPGGGFLASHLYWHPGDDVATDEVEHRDHRLAKRLARDAAAVLDGLEDLSRADGEARWSDGLDLERVGIIGHSRGGSTVTAACETDPRIDACIIFDNVGAIAGMRSSFEQPRLTVRASWSSERSQRLASILAEAEGDAFDVVIPGADHYSFTDLPLVDSDGYPSPDIEPAEAHELISRITLAFLSTYLGRDVAFRDAIADLAGRIQVRAF